MVLFVMPFRPERNAVKRSGEIFPSCHCEERSDAAIFQKDLSVTPRKPSGLQSR